MRLAEASPERVALTDRINRLEFAEYRRAGWFKAVTLCELRGSIDPGEAEALDRYAEAPADPSRDRDLIRLFLGEWLVCHHPESLSAFALDPAAFRPILRAEALAAADRIVADSLEEPRARIGGCLRWLRPASPEEAADVPYPQLRTWFAELFGDDCRFYLNDSAGGPPEWFGPANPRVMGLAPDVVGMLWLE